jgi:succinate dehydrogenase / fumarate reductase cytochrome b subunit
MSQVEAHSPPTALEARRPLSPHLQIYRWSWTMAMSIFHRATGIVLYAGTLLVVWWLVALATGPGAYEMARAAMVSPLGKLVLVGYTWAIFHHMLGGLRHFIWDMGHGYGSPTRHILAAGTLVGSILITALVWGAAYLVR